MSRLGAGGWKELIRTTVMAVAAAVLVSATLGCCTVCPQADTYTMAFGATTNGCADGCLCVCPIPDIIKVKQGDKIWLVNTSLHDVTLKAAQAGTFEAGDEVTITAENSVLVTVKIDATVGTFNLTMTVDAPGLPCPGLASPRIIVDQKAID